MAYEIYLMHHQRKGAHWGVMNGPPYPLNAEGLKRFKQSEKAQKLLTQDVKDGKNRVSRAELVAKKSRDMAQANSKLVKDLPEIETRKQKKEKAALTKQQNETLQSLNDKELQDRIRRLTMENQYRQLTTPAPKKRGREYVLETLEILGDMSSVALATAGAAAAIFALL